MDQEATNLEKRELAKTNRLSKAFLTVKKTKGVTSRRIKSDNPRTQQAREQVIGKKVCPSQLSTVLPYCSTPLVFSVSK